MKSLGAVCAYIIRPSGDLRGSAWIVSATDPAAARAPPGFGGRKAFSPDWPLDFGVLRSFSTSEFFSKYEALPVGALPNLVI